MRCSTRTKTTKTSYPPQKKEGVWIWTAQQFNAFQTDELKTVTVQQSNVFDANETNQKHELFSSSTYFTFSTYLSYISFIFCFVFNILMSILELHLFFCFPWPRFALLILLLLDAPRSSCRISCVFMSWQISTTVTMSLAWLQASRAIS